MGRLGLGGSVDELIEYYCCEFDLDCDPYLFYCVYIFRYHVRKHSVRNRMARQQKGKQTGKAINSLQQQYIIINSFYISS